MATLANLRQRFREILKLPTTGSAVGKPADAELNAVINDAYIIHMCSELSHIMPERQTIRTQFTYTAQQQSVTLPAAALTQIITHIDALPQSASDNNQFYKLLQRRVDELDLYITDGQPEYYALSFLRGRLHLRPVPQEDVTLFIEHTEAPAVLALDGDIPVLIPSNYHNTIARCAAWLYLEETQDAAGAATQEKIFQREFLGLTKFMSRAYPDIHVAHNRRRY